MDVDSLTDINALLHEVKDVEFYVGLMDHTWTIVVDTLPAASLTANATIAPLMSRFIAELFDAVAFTGVYHVGETLLALKCKFIPQRWVGDCAMEQEPPGRATWYASVPDLCEDWGVDESELLDLLKDPYRRDELRGFGGPNWVLHWTGPFEIELLGVEETDYGQEENVEAETS